MPYGVDVQGAMEFFREADAVVPDAESKLRRIPILKTLDVALASDEQACQGMQNPESGWLIDRTQVSPGSFTPTDIFLAQDLASVWTLPKQKCAVFFRTEREPAHGCCGAAIREQQPTAKSSGKQLHGPRGRRPTCTCSGEATALSA